MTNDPIELDVRARDPVDFDVAGSRPIEWGASEYIPVIATDAPEYEGPYEAAPSWERQEFDTHDRIMSSNFAVDSIIKLEVANAAGGLTLTI